MYSRYQYGESPCFRKIRRDSSDMSWSNDYESFAHTRGYHRNSDGQLNNLDQLYALRAANTAFDRLGRGVSDFRAEGALKSTPMSRIVQTPVSVRYVGPGAPPLTKKSITRRQAPSWDDVSYGSPIISKGYKRGIPGGTTISDNASPAVYHSQNLPLTPQRPSQKLKTVKSVFGANAFGNSPFHLGSRPQSSASKHKLFSSEATEISLTPSLANTPCSSVYRRSSRYNLEAQELAVTKARTECLKQLEHQRLRQAPTSAMESSSLEKSFPKTVRSNPTTVFGDAISSSMSSIKEKKGGFSIKSIGRGIKSLVSKRSKVDVSLPEQQVSSKTVHYGDSSISYADHPEHYTLVEAPSPEMQQSLRHKTSMQEIPVVESRTSSGGYQYTVAQVRRSSSFDDSESTRNPSSSTRDTWEQTASGSDSLYGSSRRPSGHRPLTTLFENQVAQPSSSAGRVGITLERAGPHEFRRPMRTTNNTNASELYNALVQHMGSGGASEASPEEATPTAGVKNWRDTSDRMFTSQPDQRDDVFGKFECPQNIGLSSAHQGYHQRSYSPVSESVYSRDEESTYESTGLSRIAFRQQFPVKSEYMYDNCTPVSRTIQNETSNSQRVEDTVRRIVLDKSEQTTVSEQTVEFSSPSEVSTAIRNNISIEGRKEDRQGLSSIRQLIHKMASISSLRHRLQHKRSTPSILGLRDSNTSDIDQAPKLGSIDAGPGFTVPSRSMENVWKESESSGDSSDRPRSRRDTD
jgi:hypothetical protein